MASKRFTKMTVDWTALAERVPEAQRPLLTAFKTKSDSYMRRMMANPEQPPKIDWSFYNSRIPMKEWVAGFQKQYDALAIQYPKDKYTELVDAQEQETKKEIAEFIKESNSRIVSHEEEIKRIKSLIPYELMTVEEFYEAHPEEAYDPANPTFWPHTEDERIESGKKAAH